MVVPLLNSLHEYNIVFFVVKLTCLLSFILISLSYFLTTFSKTIDFQKLLAYECGFQPFEDSRHLFDIKYYIIGILFVIFDLEIIILFPWSISLTTVGFEGYCCIILFLIILTLGLIYELLKGALAFI